MTQEKLKALVVFGDGINCEMETANAFRLSGFQPEIRHLNDLISESIDLDRLSREYAAVAFPGGFSFGDDLGSGKVLALKIQHSLRWDLSKYAERGGLVIGICNGFQALIRLGAFGQTFSRTVSITQNESGKFMNTWVQVTPRGNRCVWLQGLGTIDLPIRHGEGRVVMAPKSRREVLQKLERQGQLCLQYVKNPNGSEEKIAGLCDSTGRIFGLMPHPEAFVNWTNHPEWTAVPNRAGAPGLGLGVFENGFKAARGAQ